MASVFLEPLWGSAAASLASLDLHREVRLSLACCLRCLPAKSWIPFQLWSSVILAVGTLSLLFPGLIRLRPQVPCNRIWQLVSPAWSLWNHLMNKVQLRHSSSETVIHLKLLTLLIVLAPLGRVPTTGFLTFTGCGVYTNCSRVLTCCPCSSIYT